MEEATGLSLSVGTLMLGNRQLSTTTGGVFGPEGCLEPARFLTAMKEKGICAYTDLAMTKPIV